MCLGCIFAVSVRSLNFREQSSREEHLNISPKRFYDFQDMLKMYVVYCLYAVCAYNSVIGN